MDSPPWLIWLLAGVVMFLSGGQAYAAVCTQWQAYSNAGSTWGDYTSDKAAAWNTALQAQQSWYANPANSGCSPQVARNVRWEFTPLSVDQPWNNIYVADCAGNYNTGGVLIIRINIRSRSGDYCSGGPSPQELACQLARDTKTTSWVGGTGTPAIGGNTCAENGCNAVFEAVVTYKNNVTGVSSYEGQLAYPTGTTCTFNPNAPAAPTADGCKGGYFGTINGVSTCVPYSGDTNTISSATKSTSSGTTTTAQPGGGVSTIPSSETSQKDTSCAGEKCTTTETITKSNPDGTTTTQVITKEEAASEFCKNNPKDPSCKARSDSTFSGNCAAGFQCSGDAAMCAAAKAAHENKCLMDPSADVLAAAKQITDGTWAVAADLPSTVKDLGQFDQTNPFSASCPANQVVTVGSMSITVPLAQVCGELQLMGNILVAFTLLGATIFVLRGVGS